MGAVSRPCVKPPTGTGSAFSLADLSVARCRPGPSLVENVEPGQIWPSAPVHLGMCRSNALGNATNKLVRRCLPICTRWPCSSLSSPFPYAGIKPAVRALKQVGRCLGGIAREDAVSLWAVALRLRKRILETDNLSYGFRGRTVLIPHCSLLSLRYAIPRAAGTASLRC
jgi:hypothetical protein